MKYLILLLLFPLTLFATVKVGIIGDSISVGVGASPGHGYVDLLRARYASEQKDIIIYNWSYGGSYTDTVSDVTVSLITEERPKYILFFIGINDANAQVAQQTLYNNLASGISKATLNCQRVILGGVNCALYPSYDTVLSNVYTTLINTYNCYPVMLLGQDVIPYTTDGFHPNDVGAQMIADKVYNALHAVGAY